MKKEVLIGHSRGNAESLRVKSRERKVIPNVTMERNQQDMKYTSTKYKMNSRQKSARDSLCE